MILAIDTSASLLSLAIVGEGGKSIFEMQEMTRNNHSEILIHRIYEVLQSAKVKATDITKVAVANGPGSFTGVRVGVTAAKTMAYALDVPLVAISSLKVMAMMLENGKMYGAVIDARRGTVFAGVYSGEGVALVVDGHYRVEAFSELIEDFEPFDVIGDMEDIELPDQVGFANESDFIVNKAVALGRLAIDEIGVACIHRVAPNYLRKTEAEMNIQL